MCDKQGLEGFHRAFVLATLSARSRKTNESEGASMVQVQIYTNDREQPIDLEVQQMRTQAREIITNENGHHRGPSIDQVIREVIRDPAIGASANLLFTTPEGREGAIYLN